MIGKSTILLVDAGSLSPALEQELAKSFNVETVEAGQISGTLLISSAKAVVSPHRHVDEVGRAIRAAAAQLELPCLILAPPGDLAALKGRAPREVTAVIADDIQASALVIRLETALKKAASRRSRPRTLAGVGGLGPTKEAVAVAVAQAKQPIPPPPASSRPEGPAQAKRSRPSSASRIVPEDEWIRPSRPPPPPVAQPSGKPGNKRAPLSGSKPSVGQPAAEVLSLRIALVDDDVTRADAICSSLRKAGHLVFLAAGTASRVRWPLLRQFAPQALVVQQATLERDAGLWTQTTHRDPFLRQTPLVTCYFSGLYNARTGIANTEQLLPKLEGIGQAELDFGKTLKSGAVAPVDRDHINPGRLLALLTELGKSVLITCSSDPEELTWKIVGGIAGPAELKSGAIRKSLTPPQALDELLRRTDAEIVVQARSDLGHQQGQDVFELLEEAYRGQLPQTADEFEDEPVTVEDHELITSAYKNAAEHIAEHSDPNNSPPAPPSSASDSELPTKPVDVSQLPGVSQLLEPKDDSTVIHETTPKVQVPGPAPVPQLADATPDTVPPRAEEATVVQPAAPRQASDSVLEEVPTDLQHAVVGRGRKSGSGAKQSQLLKGGIAAAALAAVGVGGYLLTGGDEPATSEPEVVTAAAAAATPAPAPSANEHEKAPTETAVEPGTEEVAQTGAQELWAISNPSEAEDCESVLEKNEDDYSGKPAWRADLAWKNARRKLVTGAQDSAHKLMCEAAFMKPGGPATAGLAGLYLNQRALKQAHRWASLGVEAEPESGRKSKELLGDVLNQMGKNEEAQALWLETLKLSADNTSKLQAVARSLVKNSKKVRKGGDLGLAERLLRRAASFDGKNPEAAAGLSAVLLRNEQPGLAQAWGERAVDLDPAHAEARLTLGELAMTAGDAEGARGHFEKISKKSIYYGKAQEHLKEL